MVDFFVYTGLAVMLIGALYGTYIAVKGYRSRETGNGVLESRFSGFMPELMTPKMRKQTLAWGLIMIIGFILTGIGIAIGLK